MPKNKTDPAFVFWGPLSIESDLNVGKVKFLGFDLYMPTFWTADDYSNTTFKLKRAVNQHHTTARNYVFGDHLNHAFIMPEEFTASRKEFSELPMKDNKYAVHKVDELKRVYVQAAILQETIGENIFEDAWDISYEWSKTNYMLDRAEAIARAAKVKATPEQVNAQTQSAIIQQDSKVKALAARTGKTYDECFAILKGSMLGKRSEPEPIKQQPKAVVEEEKEVPPTPEEEIPDDILDDTLQPYVTPTTAQEHAELPLEKELMSMGKATFNSKPATPISAGTNKAALKMLAK